MCDDLTEEQEEAAIRRMRLSRRDFAALSGAAAVAACAPGEVIPAASQSPAANSSALERMFLTEESNVSFPTSDGTMDAFFVHPHSNTMRKKSPAVILWPDIAGLRESYQIMARKLAAQGYAVLAVNQYYRDAKAPVLGSFMEWRTDAGRAKLRPMIDQLSSDAVMRDAKAAVAFLDAQSAVDTARGIGSNGYCMGGPFTVYSAYAAPDRIKAAASFHGGGLVREDDQSPHKLLANTQASYLFAIAQNDDAQAPDDKLELRKAADAAGRPAEIEVYAANHGWCTLDSPVYDQAEADRAWNRMLALFEGL